MIVQWLRLHASNAGGLRLTPGQETRSYMPQLRPGVTKQINKIFFLKRKEIKRNLGEKWCRSPSSSHGGYNGCTDLPMVGKSLSASLGWMY